MKTTRKRVALASLLLSAVLLAGVLAGCTSSKKELKEGKIVDTSESIGGDSDGNLVAHLYIGVLTDDGELFSVHFADAIVINGSAQLSGDEYDEWEMVKNNIGERVKIELVDNTWEYSGMD